MALPSRLREMQKRIEAFAREYGFVFQSIEYHMMPYEEMNEIASLGGFPTRYPHWRFGMDFLRQSKTHEYGLGKLYEMIINTSPPVAYLLEGNSDIEQATVMAHCCGHADFFYNNYLFRQTDLDGSSTTNPTSVRANYSPNRKWIDRLANNGEKIRRIISRVGNKKVEDFIDCCLSLDNLIDIKSAFVSKKHASSIMEEDPNDFVGHIEVPRLRAKDYMEDFINPEEYLEEQRQKLEKQKNAPRKIPEKPERDVLGFLLKYAPLENWERDVLEVIAEESHYFAPQWQTKIMNEGLAMVATQELMTKKVLDASGIIEYAEMASGVLHMGKNGLNPYKIGLELFKDIKDRWDRGAFGPEWEECDNAQDKRNWDMRLGLGQEKVMEVRRLYSDVNFIDEFLTEDFCMRHKLFSFDWSNRNETYEISSREFKQIKEKILASLTNGGTPTICVIDGNGDNRAELVLEHSHYGQDLRTDYAREVLKSLARVWKRPTNVKTIVEGKPTVLRFDGKEYSERAARG